MPSMGRSAHNLLFVPYCDLGDASKPLLLQSSHQEREGLDALGVGLEVVALLVVDRVDLLGLDERRKLNRLLAGERQLVEVVFRHDDVLVLRVLVPALYLAPLDRAVVLGAPAQLLEARPALLMQKMEGYVLRLRSGIELDRDAHHPEADDAVPN